MVGSNMARTLVLMFDDLGLDPDPERMAQAEQWLTARTGELFAAGLEWRPGALEALRMVRAAGWPTALVTNTARALTEMALESIGREHFTVTVCGDEVPRGKPDPDPYLRAAELLGRRPPRTASRWRTRRRAPPRPSGPARRARGAVRGAGAHRAAAPPSQLARRAHRRRPFASVTRRHRASASRDRSSSVGVRSPGPTDPGVYRLEHRPAHRG